MPSDPSEGRPHDRRRLHPPGCGRALRRAAGPAAMVSAGIAALALARPATAAPCLERTPETVWVETVVSADEMILVDGRRLVLAAVEMPRLPLDDRDPTDTEAAHRLAEAARARVAERVEGRAETLLALGEDRHGRLRGHLLDTEDGHWLQRDLVEAGLLRVAPMPDDRACTRALASAETTARKARRGLWNVPAFAVRPPDRTLAAFAGSTVVVEGTVRTIGRSGGRTWLNFGDDIRRDFAVVMNDKDRERFHAAGVDVEGLRNRRVVVRGVIFVRDGPRMEIDLPEALGPVD